MINPFELIEKTAQMHYDSLTWHGKIWYKAKPYVFSLMVISIFIGIGIAIGRFTK